MAIVTLRSIRKSFLNGKRALHVINDLNLEAEQGEMIAIMGRSGSGKSTLLHILAGLIPMDSGEYHFRNQTLNFKNQNEIRTFRNRNIGYIMQNNALLFDRNVYENIALPLYYGRVKRTEIGAKVAAVANSLHIGSKLEERPSVLSGGEQQRVAIARALVQDAQILLADEPTGALDSETELDILNLFIELHHLGKTIILITHDENVAAVCGTRYILEQGTLIRCGAAKKSMRA